MNKRNVIAVVVIGLTLAACGSSDGGGEGVASLGTTVDTVDDDAGGGADGVALEAPEDPEEAFALFQACMEEHGVDMPASVTVTRDGDQKIAVGGPLVISSDDNGPDGGAPPDDEGDGESRVGPPSIDVEEMEAANEACRGHLENAAPDFDLTPEQEAAMEDARLEFDQCMRDQGVELPEMSGGEDDIGVHVAVAEGGDGSSAAPPIDIEEMEAASKICQKVYDQYPELDDVFGEGGMGAPVMVSSEAGTP
jgi:predicted small secreted protein